ncbi:unnamed protein product [Pedinophyceae sp. YPF-701]|nr:unnamed protein product [Pedinophyceae sp. YPF-701]
MASLPQDVSGKGDGGVMKTRIYREGKGDVPELHSRCLVHYTGYVLSSEGQSWDEEIFHDTRDEPGADPRVIICGRFVLKEAALNLAVASMRPGEKCRIEVESKYGFGERGNFSFPHVPPNARLAYDLELVAVEPPSDEKDVSQMLFEERLEAADRRRLRGNALFAEGGAKDDEACAAWASGLTFLDDDVVMQLEGAYLEQALKVRLALHLNTAAAMLRMPEYPNHLQEAVEHTSKVLNYQKDNLKALFRRGVASLRLGDMDGAKRDLERAAKLDPEDKAVRRELARVRQEQRALREAQRDMFAGKFGARAPEPAEKKAERPREEAAAAGAGAADAAVAEGGVEGQAPGWLGWVLAAGAIVVIAALQLVGLVRRHEVWKAP